MKKWLFRIVKILITASLVMVLGSVILKDYQKLKQRVSSSLILSYLKGERQKVKSKAMAITINQYRPFLEQWSDFVYHQKTPPELFLRESIKYYEQILIYVPQLAEAYHLLGVCYDGLGKKDLAIGSFRKAVELNPYLFWAQHNLGLTYWQAGQYREATVILRKTVLLEPDAILKMIASSRLFIEIIASLQPTGYSQSEALKTGYRNVYAMLVSSFYQMRDYRDLLYYANQAILNGFDVSGFFYYYGGIALFELKNYEQSIRFLEESLKKNSNNAEAFYYLGLSYGALQNQEAAVEAIRKADLLHKLKPAKAHFSEEDMGLKIF